MKTFCLVLLTGLTVLTARALDLTGTWILEATFDGSRTSEGETECSFEQHGEQLTGTCGGNVAVPMTGALKGQNVTWKMKAGETQETITFTAMLNDAGTSMKGRFTMRDKRGSFTAWKQ